jgi:hypothetical protein
MGWHRSGDCLRPCISADWYCPSGLHIACHLLPQLHLCRAIGHSCRRAFDIPSLATCNRFAFARLFGERLRIVAQYHVKMRRSEIAGVVFVLWVSGTLFSSPLPVYLLLRPISSRKRYIASIAVAAVALVLWFGMKKITG